MVISIEHRQTILKVVANYWLLANRMNTDDGQILDSHNRARAEGALMGFCELYGRDNVGMVISAGGFGLPCMFAARQMEFFK